MTPQVDAMRTLAAASWSFSTMLGSPERDAGSKYAPVAAIPAMAASPSQTLPRERTASIARASTAAIRLAPSMSRRRSNRSATTPATGDSRNWGNRLATRTAPP